MSVNQNNTLHETRTVQGHIMLNVVVLSSLSFSLSFPPPLLNLSKWELDVLSKQLLKLFTYSLIWWSNKPLEVGYITQKILHQHILSGNIPSKQSWFYSVDLMNLHIYIHGPESRYLFEQSFWASLNQMWFTTYWPSPHKLAIASQHRK